MTKACPLPTPAERRFGAIQAKAQDEMLRKVLAAVDEACQQTRAGLEAAGVELPAPPMEYFASVVLQAAYCRICHADPTSFAGGDPRAAIAVIRNCQDIARHHWGADLELDPRDR